MRILVSGGGTGGHISPILATVDALKQLDKDVEILYVGQEGSMEAKIAASANLKFAAIAAGKFRRYKNTSLVNKLTDWSTMALNAKDLARIARGFVQSLGIIKKFNPDAIFLKGGYVSLPVGLAARLRKVPYLIHESDTVPGLSNRVLASGAEKIAVNFTIGNYRQYWPQEKLVHTGIPVRNEFVSSHRLEGLSHFGLSEKLPVVMVMGGSGGARRINEVTIGALSQLTEDYQVLHITGEADIERVKFTVKRLNLDYPERYLAKAFLASDLGLAYAAADVVVSRAGANSIAELAILGKPVVLIPASQLRDQPKNAQLLARSEAAKVIGEDKLEPKVLISEIKHILDSPSEEQRLVSHIKEFAVPDAADRLANIILSIVKRTGE